MVTKIVKCTCNHPYQDEIYGYKNRVGNELRSGQVRCTVCSTVLGSSQSIAQQVKIKEPAKEVVKEPPKKSSPVSRPKKDDKPKKDIKLKKVKADKKSSMKGGKR